MRSILIVAAAAALVGAPAFAQVDTGNRNSKPLKAQVKPQNDRTGVSVRAVVLKSRADGRRSSAVSSRSGASVLGAPKGEPTNLVRARTKTNVLKTRSGDSKSSLASPNVRAKVLPSNNRPAVNTRGSTVAATALSAPKAGRNQ